MDDEPKAKSLHLRSNRPFSPIDARYLGKAQNTIPSAHGMGINMFAEAYNLKPGAGDS
jgi:hypothetical protein